MKKLIVCLFVVHLILPLNILASDFTPATNTKQKDSTARYVEKSNNAVTENSTDPNKSTILLTKKSNTGLYNRLLRGLLGIFVVLGLAFLVSNNKKEINWRIIIVGLIIQILLALGILKVSFIQSAFEIVSKIFVSILNTSKKGSEFVFGNLMNTDTYGFIFAFQVLPAIIFFSALTSLFFYLGIIQRIVFVMAWILKKILRITGAESLSIAGNVFLGQIESPLMIKAYLPKMNTSELFLVMTGGMATIAGAVMAAYISFLGGDDPQQKLFFAKHLLSASVMAAPGAIVISKIIVPPKKSRIDNISVPANSYGNNALDAISKGTVEGIKLVANIIAMLIVFIALIELINLITTKIGSWTHLNEQIANLTDGKYSKLTLQFILGYTLAPLMWSIGVCTEDITLVGSLLGEKIIMNEFVGYVKLAELKNAAAFTEVKSIIMATYMLCGFANFGSIGIQIGGIGALAKNNRYLVTQLGLRALAGGALASILSATIVGIILG